MKKIIYTENAPNPIGPYSQAVLAGDTLYISGQIGIDPATSKMRDSCLEDETRQVLENISAILNAADMTVDNVVKCSIFLDEMASFGQVNTIYASYFKESQPARETVAVKTLPKSVRVEISAIAVK